jgi:hypothetical protein
MTFRSMTFGKMPPCVLVIHSNVILFNFILVNVFLQITILLIVIRPNVILFYFMLVNVFLLNSILLIVIQLNVILLGAMQLSVILLSITVSSAGCHSGECHFTTLLSVILFSFIVILLGVTIFCWVSFL